MRTLKFEAQLNLSCQIQGAAYLRVFMVHDSLFNTTILIGSSGTYLVGCKLECKSVIVAFKTLLGKENRIQYNVLLT